MALSTDKISSVKNTLSQKPDPIQDIQDNVTSAISDPFGAVISKVITKIGGLTTNTEAKINDLADQILKSSDNKGRVSMQDNTIVITIEPEDLEQANVAKSNIENKIASIQKTLNTLQVTINTLNTIQTGISVLLTAITIQEIALSSNPGTGPIFQVLKQGIKVIFLKDIIKVYANILKKQLRQNTKSFDRLSNKFRNLRVSVVVQDEKNKGNTISAEEAASKIADDLLGSKPSSEIESVSEDYVDNNQIPYILKVEKYDNDRLIARAYTKDSGFIKQQTSPSYFATAEELLEELKTILNIEG